MTVYEVHVATGELWNAGTEANVYISVHGNKGDTGSRQLFRSKNSISFLRGQVSDEKALCLIFFLNMAKIHRIKFTIFSIFKCTIQ